MQKMIALIITRQLVRVTKTLARSMKSLKYILLLHTIVMRSLEPLKYF